MRDTERQTETQSDRERHRKRETQTDRQRQKRRDRGREKERQTQTDTDRWIAVPTVRRNKTPGGGRGQRKGGVPRGEGETKTETKIKKTNDRARETTWVTTRTECDPRAPGYATLVTRQ